MPLKPHLTLCLKILTEACKKWLFIDPYAKVCLYFVTILSIQLFTSLAAPSGGGYFADHDNDLYRYFVKYTWGWNLALLLPFVTFTANVYCCGATDKILNNHLVRIAVATFLWWTWTTLFVYAEAVLGVCDSDSDELFFNRGTCTRSGYYWSGVQISSNTFLFVYSSLVLMEESRCMINWDEIVFNAELEKHSRASRAAAKEKSPLRGLSDVELQKLIIRYYTHTPIIKIFFVGITSLQTLWDFMLVCTVAYEPQFLLEKFAGAFVAVATWLLTYKAWFDKGRGKPKKPKLPGKGVFLLPLSEKKSKFAF